MDNSPWFDHPDQFDQERIRLADIDGSGVTDIIYLERDGVALYFNQSGNAGARGATAQSAFPRTDSSSSVTVVDLLGNGTACLVWSSPLPGDARAAYALHRSDGWTKTAPADRNEKQSGRGNARAVRPFDKVLPCGQGGRKAVDHATAVPRARGRAGRDATTASAATASSHATPIITATSTASNGSFEASGWSSSSTPRSSRRSRRAATLPEPTNIDAVILRPSRLHQDLVPHRRLSRGRTPSRSSSRTSTTAKGMKARELV